MYETLMCIRKDFSSSINYFMLLFLSCYMCVFYSAFNNVWSNIGYLIMGLTFLGVVAVRYALHVYIVISLIKKENYMHVHMYRGTSVLPVMIYMYGWDKAH